MNRFAGALLAAIVGASPAVAAWDFAELPSAFRDEPDYLLGVENDDAGITLRCRDETVRAYFEMKGGGTNALAARMGAGKVEGAYRVDDRAVATSPAIFDVTDGNLRVEFPVTIALPAAIALAERRVAVAVLLDDNIVYEAQFDVQGAQDAAQNMVDNCLR